MLGTATHFLLKGSDVRLILFRYSAGGPQRGSHRFTGTATGTRQHQPRGNSNRLPINTYYYSDSNPNLGPVPEKPQPRMAWGKLLGPVDNNRPPSPSYPVSTVSANPSSLTHLQPTFSLHCQPAGIHTVHTHCTHCAQHMQRHTPRQLQSHTATRIPQQSHC
ncbi:hypothetical protein FKM82_029213 [Ascaphus truei]